MDRQYETLWVFGPSLTLPWGLANPELGWTHLLAAELGTGQIKHFGRAALDNFFIYQEFLQYQTQIQPQDLVIIGWSHPNRKMFVLDRQNPVHVAALPSSLCYTSNDIELIRSNHPLVEETDSSAWHVMKPKFSGIGFYDRWFRDYFSDYEQRCNFQAYYDSARNRAPCQCVSVFFSKESTEGMMIDPSLFYLDFVIEHDVPLSASDLHLNAHGHDLFAHRLLPFIP